MNKSILAFSLAVSIPALAAAAEPCFGPVCVDAPVANPPDRVLCLGDFGCMPVVYETAGRRYGGPAERLSSGRNFRRMPAWLGLPGDSRRRRPRPGCPAG